MIERTQPAKRPADKPAATRKPGRFRVGSESGSKATAPGEGAARREGMIREAAYFRAERRAFAPGYELEDWFAAEREIDCALARSNAPDRRSAGRARPLRP